MIFATLLLYIRIIVSKTIPMKKIVMMICLVAGVASVAQAQARFGVKAGYTNSTWSGDLIDADEKKSNNGFHAGLVAEWGLKNNFFFQPHLMFVRKGVRVDHGDHMDNINVSSIDLPLNFVWKSSGEKARFFGGTGPQVGLNVGAKLVAKEENEEESLNIGNSETDDLKPFDFGWNFLAGVELKNNLFFSVNYSLGLANLNPASDLTAKSNYFGVSLGYFFGGAKKAK